MLFFGACSEDTSSDSAEGLQFDVNPELLAEAYSDASSGILLHPPVGWQKASAPLFDAFKSRLQQQILADSLYQLNPIQLFGSFEDGRILIISEIDPIKPVSSLKEFAADYQSDLKTKFTGVSIRSTDFAINHIPVHQYLLVLDKMVAFKIILNSPTGKYLQLDYSISRQSYADIVKSIEASIGSLRALETS